MQQDRLHLQIVTAAGVSFDAMVSYVGLPLVGGSIGILPGHAPLLAALAAGNLICTTDGERRVLPVSAGIVEVSSNHVLVLSQPV